MKRLVVNLILIILCSMFLVSCEEKDEQVSISGESTLLVDNSSNQHAKVYFDGNYIGRVKKGEKRIWSVPTGYHEVRIKGEEWAEDTESAFFFEGQIITIEFDVAALYYVY